MTTPDQQSIEALTATVELLQQENEQLRADAAAARRRADRLRQELDVIRTSRLWKVAELVRRIARPGRRGTAA